jgi:hypothetical protein
MDYELDSKDSIPDRDKILLSISQRLNLLWDSLSLLSNGYRGLFLLGLSGRGVKLTAHFHPVPRSRIMELYFHSPHTS